MPLPKKLFTVLDLPVLRALIADAGLTVVDIGGRGSAFYPMLTVAPFTHYVVSEPDAAEAARLREELPREAPWREITVIDAAIGSRRGRARLYVTSEPGMSSLLQPDAEVVGRVYLAGKFDVVNEVDVPVVPLDDASVEHGFADASFVKIDTQGTELDILQSAPRLVAESLLGVHTEACFQPFYRGQAVFADVDAFLRRQGFVLFTLNRTSLRRRGFRPSLYSKRMVAWAHCLYLREPEHVMMAADLDRRRLLGRFLALALAFQHLDLAFELAALARRAALLPASDLARLDDEVERCAEFTTRYVRKKVDTATPADTLLSPSFRDKGRLE
jgi:FkbM family methyltransferase